MRLCSSHFNQDLLPLPVLVLFLKPFAAQQPLHRSGAYDKDDNVKQLDECSSLHLSMQELERNWKECYTVSFALVVFGLLGAVLGVSSVEVCCEGLGWRLNGQEHYFWSNQVDWLKQTLMCFACMSCHYKKKWTVG